MNRRRHFSANGLSQRANAVKFGAFVTSLLVCAQAQANVIEYTAQLSGPAEATPNNSPGTGLASVFYDDQAHTLQVNVTFAGLLGPTTASHIHASTPAPFTGAAGVATQVPTFVDFPLGVTAGTYSRTLDLTLPGSFNPTFVSANGGTAAGAEAALATALEEGRSYLNVHSSKFPGGEIRGFLAQVPDGTATGPLLAATVVVLVGVRESRRWRRP